MRPRRQKNAGMSLLEILAVVSLLGILAGNLSDIGANSSYFPDGLPICPVDGSSYSIDTTTLRVNGHTH